MTKLFIIGVIVISAAVGQENKDVQAPLNQRDSSGEPTRQQGPSQQDLKEQREQFQRAIREIEGSTALRQARERLERDLVRMSPTPPAPAWPPDSEAQRRILDAAQQFRDLESSPDIQYQKRTFQQEMKRLESSPEFSGHREKLQNAIKSFELHAPVQAALGTPGDSSPASLGGPGPAMVNSGVALGRSAPTGVAFDSSAVAGMKIPFTWNGGGFPPGHPLWQSDCCLGGPGPIESFPLWLSSPPAISPSPRNVEHRPSPGASVRGPDR